MIVNPHEIVVITAYSEVAEFPKLWVIGSGDRFTLRAFEILYEQDLSAVTISQKAALVATKVSPECVAPVIVQTVQQAN
ncbi:MAG: hypothetical protein AAF959_07555 [Cyanobacteria bacterium P01_D01_bin.56]